MEKGIFTISLDFELHWGLFDILTIEQKAEAYRITCQVIPQMLDLFEEFDVEVTWAIVGMLYNKNESEWQNNFPSKIPNFINSNLSAYNFANQGKPLSTYPHSFFAPHLIEKIKNAKGQEIGTHTYAHYYCLEPGQNQDDFDEDLKKAVGLAQNKDVKIQSIVFPRNQFNEEYVDACVKNNIIFLRTNPKVWFWDTKKKQNLRKKIVRTLDCYLPLSKTTYKIGTIIREKGVSFLPASRFLREPSKFGFLDRMRIKRIKNEMYYAAKNNEVYHLWWHPHNFSKKSIQSLQELKEIFEHYKFLEQKFGMVSKSMKNTFH